MSDQNPGQPNSADAEQDREREQQPDSVIGSNFRSVEQVPSQMPVPYSDQPLYPGQSQVQPQSFYLGQLPVQVQVKGRSLSATRVVLLALIVAAIIGVGGYFVLQNLVPPLVATNILLVLIFAAIIGVGGYFVLK